MQELPKIIEVLEQLRATDQSAVLATVVSLEGSAYRQPGARMLITPNGQTIGTISGGCLENDVIERAQQVFISGETIVVNYDMTSDEDIIWGLGLGCNGVVCVLIEPIQLNSDSGLFEFLSTCLQQKQPGVIATIFSLEGQTKLRVGDRLMLHPTYAVTNTIEEPALVQSVFADACDILRTKCPQTKAYLLPNGIAEIFIEIIQPPTSIVIFGSGHDALPVVHFSNLLNWNTTVVDTRCLELSRERFHTANEVILARPEDCFNQVRLNTETIVLVMTHNYLHDQQILKALLPSPARYIGVLGSKKRINRLLQEFSMENLSFTQDQINRLHSPAGLDIGADTPEEIALSIVSEIQAVIAGRSGGFLRDRQGAIHFRPENKAQLNFVYVDGLLVDV